MHPRNLEATLTTDISLTGENRLLECPEIIVIQENQTLESRSIDLSFQCRDDVVNTGCQENGLLMSSKFISTPLRLTGGGETSFEYQGNVSIEHESNVLVVNVPTISTPVRLSECEGTSHECVIDGNSLPVDKIGINDMPWENDTNISDISSSAPPLHDISTPADSSNESILSPLPVSEPMANQYSLLPANLNPLANPFFPLMPDFSFSDTTLSASVGNVSSSDGNDPLSVLKGLKEKNLERPIIAHLNINSLSSKFEPFMDLIKDTIDFLLVTESKLDGTFPPDQFQIEGFSRPIRLDRNRNGGGLIIFVRDGLTCKELKPRKLYPGLECTFLELRIRQCKWLVVVGYNPQKEKIADFLDQLSIELDIVICLIMKTY